MNSNHPDLDDIHLNSPDSDIENMDTLDDLEGDLLGDDFEDPAPRPKKRGFMGLLVLVLAGFGIVAAGSMFLMGDGSNHSVVASIPTPSPVVTLASPSEPQNTDHGPSISITEDDQVFVQAGDLPPQPRPVANDPAVADVGPVPDTANAVVPVIVDTDGKKPEQAVATAPELPPVIVPMPAPEKMARTIVPQPAPTAQKPIAPKVETKTAATIVETKDIGKPAQKLAETQRAVPKTNADKKEAIVSPMPPPAPVTKDDEFLESTETISQLAEATRPRFTIPEDQIDRGLGVTVGGAVADDPEGMIAAANKALELGRNETALEMFEKMYRKNKRDERILMGRAVAFQKLGRRDDAIRAYDELLALNPNNADVATNMLGLVQQQNPSVALQRLLQLRARYPENATVVAQTGLANASVGNLEEGLRYLSIAASLEPGNSRHYFNMGIISEKMGKPDLAIAAYEKALTVDATSDDDKNRIDRDVVYDRLSVLRQR